MKKKIDVTKVSRGHNFVANLTARQRVIPSKKVYKREKYRPN